MVLNTPQLLSTWKRFRALPFGRRLFSRMLGRLVPYSGSIGAVVQTLEKGHVEVLMTDRPRVRNHLNCLHAVALINLAELCSGLAVMSHLPDGSRAILTGFRMRYLKKARGNIRAQAHFAGLEAGLPEKAIAMELSVTLKNAQDEEVAQGVAEWTISRTPPAGSATR